MEREPRKQVRRVADDRGMQVAVLSIYSPTSDHLLHCNPDMPVQLPLQPVGIDLLDLPQDPPMLADVVAAKSFQTRVDVAVG